ncbi:hypothetical protein PsAD46_01017 [Pseudovibrio sp. Ad46]|uniref:DUF2165 domain-containing protein n=1 Tax=unclassified Pseudovibrio TaxID=2627060 RepID=UPI0007AE7CC5|nr:MULTISPECIES: DUF2165 domain-containing protein [unclassified Pseudovibrio]KZK94594.1 hypothetical protein PsAD46_01017 [Pseudovibrio sp. Ad46]KZL01655.1 hypothetical protein PsAD5_00579 [Pseudovibrio sp. Ad5]
MLLRLIKVLVSLAFGGFAALVCFNNYQDTPANLAYIETVISMVDTFPTSPKFRAVFPLETAPTFLTIILAIEGFIALLLVLGSLRMLASIHRSAASFNRSKSTVSFGFCIAILLWFGIFVTGAGEWFLAWQSPLGRGAIDTSYNISIIAFLALIFVNQKEEDHG